MTRFAALFAAIDATTSTGAKVEAMARYFAAAPPADAAWAVYFLTGRRLKRLVPGRAIGQWTLAATGLPEWMLGECYAVVGDGAETAALLLDHLEPVAAEARSLADWVECRLGPLRDTGPAEQQRLVIEWLRGLPRWERFTLLKLVTGELRVGVSQTLVVRALAQVAVLPPATLAARLMGDWTPSAEWFQRLVALEPSDADRSRPLPFFLAAPLAPSVRTSEALAELLGERRDWLIEWKWDGIRAQLVARGDARHLWSRGEELISDRFPELVRASLALPEGTVLDGEVVAWRDDRPLPFAALQQRIGRQRQIARVARDVPVVFMVYDVLEHAGVDVRHAPLITRRELVEALIAAVPVSEAAAGIEMASGLPFDDDDGVAGGAAPLLRISPSVTAATWAEAAQRRAEARPRGVEGLMLKRLTAPYGVGRKRGDWWKWKIDPHTVDAVLIYAQPGSGKRASLLTDYTFGLWHEGALVPVAKAYSGLTNEEIAEIDRWIRRHTVERFGPVRHVEPVHVFELGFEAIARSTRHRSGVAVRFPRMLRWRKDKLARDADRLDALTALLPRA